jgi:ornithine carbamoyltransferase
MHTTLNSDLQHVSNYSIVKEDVLEGFSSIAFVQAENKLNGAHAVLEWCFGV